MLKANYKWLIALAIILILSPFTSTILGPYGEQVVLLCGINIVLAVSLNLVNGFTGQFSIGHAGFMSIGAYTSAIITTIFYHELFTSSLSSILFAIPLVAGGIAASLMGYLV